MTDRDPVRAIVWRHGRAELQRLGAMLAPVVFRADGAPDFAPLQVAPWADEPAAPGSVELPGILRRLRGEWPCVPFGRTDRPELPAGWSTLEPDDDFAHGYASHHDWRWLPGDDPLALTLAIDYPAASPVKRLRRSVRALPDAPALALTLEVEVRAACRLPVALHPVLRLDAGRVALRLRHGGAVHGYPVAAEPGVSRLAPGCVFTHLDAAPLADGGCVDFSRFPLPFDCEELLQVQAASGPAVAHFLDRGWAVQIDWERAALPDVMLWVSHRGRRQPPWNGRHLALGIEPVNGVFDLGRVAVPPAGHPLAARRGVTLTPDRRWTLRAEIRAWPQADPAPASPGAPP